MPYLDRHWRDHERDQPERKPRRKASRVYDWAHEEVFKGYDPERDGFTYPIEIEKPREKKLDCCENEPCDECLAAVIYTAESITEFESEV